MPSAEPRRPRRPRRFARPPELVVHEVVINDLDPRHDGVKITHLTDVHCGTMTPEHHVRSAVDLANGAGPDLIVMTGDYVNWRRKEVAIAAEQLAGLVAPRVLVTLGNHDYMASGDGVTEAMRGNGYTVLKNEHTTVDVAGHSLHVVGIDDPVTRRHDVDRAFSEVPDGGTRLVLCHCPEQVDKIASFGAHLVLSGHTHGGQINVKGVTDRIYRAAGRRYYYRGFYRVSETLMYVSAGVGFSGLRVRAGHGTQAEVSLFVLRRATALRAAG